MGCGGRVRPVRRPRSRAYRLGTRSAVPRLAALRHPGLPHLPAPADNAAVGRRHPVRGPPLTRPAPRGWHRVIRAGGCGCTAGSGRDVRPQLTGPNGRYRAGATRDRAVQTSHRYRPPSTDTAAEDRQPVAAASVVRFVPRRPAAPDRAGRGQRICGSATELVGQPFPEVLPTALVQVFGLSRSALILGSGQKESIADLPAAEAAGVDVARRRSGGGAALLAGGAACGSMCRCPA